MKGIILRLSQLLRRIFRELMKLRKLLGAGETLW